MELQKLENSIGYTFKNRELLKNALTHTSYAFEKHIKSNEKLEFLGDSILEFITSKYLYNNYPKLSEGEMTKVRAAIVCEESLYKIAKKHNFDNFIFLGRSETAIHKEVRKAIMADSVEAVMAAIYFDSNLQQAERFIIENLKEEVAVASKNVGQKDYKTVLQEKLQVNGEVYIKYEIVKEEGPDHDKKFTARVSCNNKILATGEGRTKKAAQMQAAKKALYEQKVNI